MIEQAFVERMHTAILVPPGLETGPLRHDLDRVATHGLGQALHGSPLSRLPERSVLLIRQLKLRLRLPEATLRTGDSAIASSDALVRAWCRAIRTGVDTLAAPVLARSGAPFINGEIAYFPDVRIACAEALRAAQADDHDTWWVDMLIDGDAPAAVGRDRRARLAAIVMACRQLGARETAAIFALVLDRSAGGIAATLPAPVLDGLIRFLVGAPTSGVARPTALSAAGSDTEIEECREALVRVSPASATWIRRSSPAAVRLAAAVALASGVADRHPREARALRVAADGRAGADMPPSALPTASETRVAPVNRKTASDDADRSVLRGSVTLPATGRARSEASAHPVAEPALRGADAVGSNAEVVAEAAAAAPGHPVDMAGLLFLIRPALARFGDRRSQPPADAAPQACLHALGRLAGNVVLGTIPVGERPAWRQRNAVLLGVIAGAAAPENDAALDALWAEAGASAHAWAEAGFARLAERLPADISAASPHAGDDPWTRLILRSGHLELTPTHATLHLPMERVDLALRRAGWDIDPGWLPLLGRVIRFVYRDDRSIR